MSLVFRFASRAAPHTVLWARHLSTARNPQAVLGLHTGATKAQVKARFYELAKQVHPDVSAGDSTVGSSSGSSGSGSSNVTFVEVVGAYEALLAELEAAAQSGGQAGPRTAPTKAAGGGSSADRRTVRPPSKTRAEWRVGEVLCEQLLDVECTTATLEAVWDDVKTTVDHSISEFMIDAIIGACARTGGGLDAAINILADGKESGTLGSTTLQTATVCAMMKWLGDDERMSFEFAVTLVDEWRRTPDDFERLQSAYYVHFGYDPMSRWL
jgi:hypothetical protein